MFELLLGEYRSARELVVSSRFDAVGDVFPDSDEIFRFEFRVIKKHCFFSQP
jgi:hypothetical protein